MNKEIVNRYGIVEWYSRESVSNDLFSLSNNDPALLAEADGYELSAGKPFIVNVFIGEWDKVVTQLIIFDSYVNKVRFERDKVIIQNL